MTNWIKGAVKRPGALTRKAKAASLSTSAFAQKHQHDRGRTGQQARLALTFAKMKKKNHAKTVKRRAPLATYLDG